MPATPLTILIPCKDELPNIDACIDSAAEIADEILIADSGSTDGTLERVRARGDCRVIEREYVCSSDFKNWAIPQAKHEWILLIDADERVTPELRNEIAALKQRGLDDQPHDAFWIARKNIFMGREIRYSGWSGDGVVRLFRRSCRYEPKWVHAELDLPAEKVGSLKHAFLHYTFRDFDHFMAKQIRYANWGAEDLRSRGKHSSVLNLTVRPFYRFLRQYVFQRGFLDGKAGLIIAGMSACGVFWKYAKLHAMQQQPNVARETKSQDTPLSKAA